MIIGSRIKLKKIIWLSEADMQRQSHCGCKFYEDLNGWSYKI